MEKDNKSANKTGVMNSLTPRSESQYQIRLRRKERVIRLHRIIEKTRPKLFLLAHLRNLGVVFRERLLDFDENIGIILHGPVGRGKSYALCALMRYFIIQKKTVKRITYEMLCLQIRDTYKSSSKKTELDIIQPLIDCDCLFIEDIGSTITIGKEETDFSTRTFFVLLDSRLEACKPTFISTNKTQENIAKSFGERIASRLSLFSWLGTGGKDQRQKK